MVELPRNNHIIYVFDDLQRCLGRAGRSQLRTFRRGPVQTAYVDKIAGDEPNFAHFFRYHCVRE